ncbi:MAG: hypothetical protein ACFE9Z_12875 [Promethearchaeota archaeon]
MNENREEGTEEFDKKDENLEDDDLETYLREMETLETDFSDLEDFDIEELQEIQSAITKVKESENISEATLAGEEKPDTNEIEVELQKQINIKESMITDFSDMDEIDFDELKEMQEAIETVKSEKIEDVSEDITQIDTTQVVSKELEDRIKQELIKRKEQVEEEIITPEKFLDYIKNKRDKIWYHALYYLVMNVEDNTASKSLLYDVLKEVTSKSPIDPIPEHQFYFGLGYILRLSLDSKQVVRFQRDGKFKINVNVDNLKSILEEAGEPISTKPIMEEEEKKKMFKEFLDEDFFDI